MVSIRIFLLWVVSLIVTIECFPDYTHHVHHRIHVPQKIKTIYHTKIIKVPEHHHHYHEKEKTVVVEKPKPVYIEKEKPIYIEKEKPVFIEKPKEEHHFEHHHLPLEGEDWAGGYGGEEAISHNIFKKHINEDVTSMPAKRKRKSH